MVQHDDESSRTSLGDSQDAQQTDADARGSPNPMADQLLYILYN